MSFIIGNVISVCKTFISGVSKAAILAMSGLVAWVFDEDEGIADYVGDTVGDQRRAIQPGRCYVFDGINDYIDTALVFGPSGNYEVSVWVNTTITGSNSFMVDGRDGASDGFIVFQTSADVIRFSHNSTNATSIGSYNDGEWYKIICNKTGTTITLTIQNSNGVNQETPVTSTVSTGALSVTTTLRLGARSFSGASGHYAGCLRDLNMTEGTILTAQYKMEEGAGVTSYDSSGNAYHGTITNATLSRSMERIQA
jgi:hypothetical protein